MRSWASVASRGEGAPRRQGHVDQHAHEPAIAPTQPSSAEELLREATRSRADVTGERRCLACGRAFRDIHRFAQHLKDAHGGRNMAQPLHPPAAPSGAFPSLRASVQLGDVLLRALPAFRPDSTASFSPAQRPASRQQAQQQGTAWQRTPTPASLVPAARSAAASSKAAPVLTPPPGTRFAKAKKRESRLKRAFKRSGAAQACGRWQGVLAELEAAMQAVGEAQGSLANQLTGVQQQQGAAAEPPATAALALGAQQEQDRLLLLANLAVRRQLLEQQLGHAEECREKLQRAHAHARKQLAAAQLQLQKADKVPPPADDLNDGAASSAEAAGCGQPEATPAATKPHEAPQAAAGRAADEAGEPADAQRQQQQDCHPTAASEASPAAASDGSEEGAASEAAVSTAPSSSLGSFAFQDVLTGWTAASSRQAPNAAAAAAAHVAPGGTRQRAAAGAGGSRGAAVAVGAPAKQLPTAGAAAILSSGPATAAAPGGVPPSSQPAGFAARAQEAGSGGVDGGASGGDDSGSDSSDGTGSFGLQWGDQLLSWASNVRVEAAAVALHATQPQPQVLPAQQQQQQQQQLLQQQPQQQQQQQQQQGAAHDAAEPAGAAEQARPAAPLLSSNAVSQPGTASSAAGMPGAAPPDAGQQQQLQAVDVAAWLSSTGAAVPPLEADEEALMLLSESLAPVAVAAALAQTHHSEQAQPQQQAEYVQAAADVPGAFRCLLCQVTVSGQRNLQEHLGSKRHTRRVAAEAAAAAAASAGLDAQRGLGLADSAPTAGAGAGAGVGGRSDGMAGGGGGGGGGGGRTYVGPGADVAPYVCQVITPELNATAEALLRRLLEWQERSRLHDPANFKRKRRVVSGLREVEKAIKVRRAKLVLLAPNISSLAAADAEADGGEEEEAEGGGGTGGPPAKGAAAPSAPAGGSGGAVRCPAAALVALAREREVPLVFALSRQRLGKLMGQRKRASAFAVLDANGVFEELRRLLQLGEEGRRQWQAARAPGGGGAGGAAVEAGEPS